MIALEKILESIKPTCIGSLVPTIIIGIDPGNTTGISILSVEKSESSKYIYNLIVSLQLPLIEESKSNNGKKNYINWEILESRFKDWYILNKKLNVHIVIENYRVYQSKLERHSFSEVPTLQLIGGIDFLLYKYDFQDKTCWQMAQQAKQFITDDKLKYWNLYTKCEKHSRDALRHVLYWLIVKNRT